MYGAKEADLAILVVALKSGMIAVRASHLCGVEASNMQPPSVYIESTVVSYYTARPSRNLIVAAHQQLTTEWWENVLPMVTPHISPLVLDEIARGDSAAAEKRLQAVQAFAVLEVLPEVADLAEKYFNRLELPDKARADAYHIATAVWHGLDYMVTWNCAHIASGRVLKMIDEINAAENIKSPFVCTPEELMEP